MLDAPNESPIEILTPSPTVVPVLTALRDALDQLSQPDRLTARAWFWDDLPVLDFSKEVSRYRLMTLGVDGGFFEGSANSNDSRDLLHHLSNELDIMSEQDLSDQFRGLIEGSHLSKAFRTVYDADVFEDLIRNEIGLGWGGIELIKQDKAEIDKLRRQRMFADYFRGGVTWTQMRAWDASGASILILAALSADMLTSKRASQYLSRAAGELIVRYGSWHAFAKALLIARVYEALGEGAAKAAEVLEAEKKRLDELLSGPWAAFPWPKVKSPDAGIGPLNPKIV